MPKFNVKSNYIPVSRDFIENKMPSANGAYVKVYIASLLLGYDGVEMSTSGMSRLLGLLESDIVNALEYWNEKGALKYDGGNVLFDGASPIAGRDTADTTKNEEQEEEEPKPPERDIAAEMTENKALSDLCAIAAEILERPLKKRDMETLYWFYDELELSPEVITLLLEYCVSKDKRGMSFIEKTAIKWHKNGITTLGAADDFIRGEKDSESYIGAMKRLFNFGDRKLSKSEEDTLNKWRTEYGMDEDMVSLAYEYSLDAIHQLSFPYIDTILKRWKELGITTVEAAKKDHDDFKSGKNNISSFGNSNTSYEEIKKIIREKM